MRNKERGKKKIGSIFHFIKWNQRVEGRGYSECVLRIKVITVPAPQALSSMYYHEERKAERGNDKNSRDCEIQLSIDTQSEDSLSLWESCERVQRAGTEFAEQSRSVI